MLAHALALAERHADAVASCHEGLVVIAPFVERQAQAFGGLARALSQIYIEACEKAGTARDSALVERVARAPGS